MISILASRPGWTTGPSRAREIRVAVELALDLPRPSHRDKMADFERKMEMCGVLAARMNQALFVVDTVRDKMGVGSRLRFWSSRIIRFFGRAEGAEGG